jgi:heme-degrading monooxygenase HmoA
MYMRFLRLKVREEWLGELQRYYTERVVPALRGTPGCMYASLLQTAAPVGPCVSLTLWRDAASALAYESGSLFSELLAECSRFLDGSAPVRAASPGTAGRSAAEGYELLEGPAPDLSSGLEHRRLHMHVVALLVQEGKSDLLAELYRREVAPALEGLKGFVGAFLVEASDKPNQALSLTFWDRDGDAIRYELSGAFDSLTSKLQEALSSLYLWKHSLRATSDAGEITTGDLRVERYTLVVGELFPPQSPGGTDR